MVQDRQSQSMLDRHNNAGEPVVRGDVVCVYPHDTRDRSGPLRQGLYAVVGNDPKSPVWSICAVTHTGVIGTNNKPTNLPMSIYNKVNESTPLGNLRGLQNRVKSANFDIKKETIISMREAHGIGTHHTPTKPRVMKCGCSNKKGKACSINICGCRKNGQRCGDRCSCRNACCNKV